MKQSRWVLLLCIGIAFIIWAFYTLSNEYSAYFRYELDVETNLEGHSHMTTADNSLYLRGKARGFHIIRDQWRKQIQRLHIVVDPQLVHPTDPSPECEHFYILSDDIHNLVNEALGSRMSLESIITESLSLTYPLELFKKVPVIFMGALEYAPQYMSFSQVHLIPDSVLIYGEIDQLQAVQSVSTHTVSLTGLYQSVDGLARLDVPDGLRVSEKEVRYDLTVDRYVEVTYDLPIEAVNVPRRQELILLPDKVSVKVRVPFFLASSLTPNDFSLAVDYEDFVKSHSGKVVPILKAAPATVANVTFIPEFVDGIVQSIFTN